MVPLNDKDLISLGGNHTVDEVQGEKRLFVYRLIILRKSLFFQTFYQTLFDKLFYTAVKYRYSKGQLISE